jgi:hypothetical protein
MTDQFNSKTRQAKSKATLNQLRLDDIRAEKGIYTLDALEKVRDQISILSAQFPPGILSDAHHVDALLDAVLRDPWASKTLNRHGANPVPVSFQSLFQALESALDLIWLKKKLQPPPFYTKELLLEHGRTSARPRHHKIDTRFRETLFPNHLLEKWHPGVFRITREIRPASAAVKPITG